MRVFLICVRLKKCTINWELRGCCLFAIRRVVFWMVVGVVGVVVVVVVVVSVNSYLIALVL